ncbi:MAG: glycine-rich protein [Myxococcales bacterium]
MSIRNVQTVLSFLFLVCGLLSGCTTENVPATQLLVVVNSDLAVGSQLTAVEVEIQSADGAAEKPDTRRFELSQAMEDGHYRLPLSFGVVRGSGGSNNIRVIVRGFGPSLGGVEALVVEQKSLVAFENKASQRLTVFLGGTCYQVLCTNTEQSCYSTGLGAIGVCTDLTEGQLEDVKPGDEFDGIVLPNDDGGTTDSGQKNDGGSIPVVPQAALSVMLAGDGTGTVTSSAGGIDCGSTCTGSVDQGSMVTLTATAAEDSAFMGWSGGGCTGTDPCTLTVASATTVTASFAKTHYLLHVNMGGTGVGVVASSDAEISCGTECEALFMRGSVVELTPSATTGTTFLGWSGGGCEGLTVCKVTVNGPVNVLANFACTAGTGSQTFYFSDPGGPQAVNMKPPCVRTVTIEAQGAAGGYGREKESNAWVTAGYYGYGGRALATVTLNAGDTLTVFVGSRGGDGNETTLTAGAGGYNGGGAGSTAYGDRYAGGGGGASDVRVNWNADMTEEEQLATRIVVGGGGGGGSPCNQVAGGVNGGYGGGANGGGAPPSSCYATYGSVVPQGGTSAAGGAGGTWLPNYGTAASGSLGKGGNAGPALNGDSASGGGGGGYYGGGAGMWEAGAGGSSWATSTATNVTLSENWSYGGYVQVSW